MSELAQHPVTIYYVPLRSLTTGLQINYFFSSLPLSYQASSENEKLKAELDKLNQQLEDERQKVEDLMFRSEEENINKEDYNVNTISYVPTNFAFRTCKGEFTRVDVNMCTYTFMGW